ncbi:MAG: hypothetical protein ACK53L_33705, partial [Pirellulaceae bacterium]
MSRAIDVTLIPRVLSSRHRASRGEDRRLSATSRSQGFTPPARSRRAPSGPGYGRSPSMALT